MITYLKLNSFLIDHHSEKLNKLNIYYSQNKLSSSISYFELMYKKDRIFKEFPSTQNAIKLIQNTLIYAIIGFIGFGLLGVLTVIQTW